MKQSPSDANLTLNELQSMVQKGNYDKVTRKLVRYTKNVTETNTYWNNVKGKMKAAINQVGAPTIFWTLPGTEFN